MKLFFIISALFICSISFSQIGQKIGPPSQNLGGNPNAISRILGFVKADSGIIIGQFTDTSVANAGRFIKMAQNVLIRVGSNLYARDTVTSSWVSVGGGDSSAGVKKIDFNFDSTKYIISTPGAAVDSVATGIRTLIGLGPVSVRDSSNGNTYVRFDTTGFNGGNVTIPGGPFTSIPTEGFNPGVNVTAAQTIIAAFYQSQVPTATLSGGGNFELTSASTLSQTLNWTASRQAKTATLNSIVVASVSQTFTQPSPPGTVGGTQSVSVPTNTTTTYTNTVTTTDGKTAVATVTYAYFPKRYWFYSSTASPSSADVVSDLGGGNELTTGKAKPAQFTVTISGTSKTVSYAYPSSYGTLSSIVVSGLESIGAFHLNIVSVTNAGGAIQNYNVYTSNNTFNAGSFVFTSVQ